MEENGGWWIAAGGVVIAIGSLAPWVTATTVFGSISRSGIDDGGDGLFTLVFGVALVLIGGTMVSGRAPNRVTRIPGWILVALTGLIFAIDFADVSDAANTFGNDFANASVGFGLWLVAIGALVAAVGVLNMPTVMTPTRTLALSLVIFGVVAVATWSGDESPWEANSDRPRHAEALTAASNPEVFISNYERTWWAIDLRLPYGEACDEALSVARVAGLVVSEAPARLLAMEDPEEAEAAARLQRAFDASSGRRLAAREWIRSTCKTVMVETGPA